MEWNVGKGGKKFEISEGPKKMSSKKVRGSRGKDATRKKKVEREI